MKFGEPGDGHARGADDEPGEAARASCAKRNEQRESESDIESREISGFNPHVSTFLYSKAFLLQ